MPPVVRIQDLTRRFGQVRAVDQLTLDIEQGEVFGLLGHNGAGKTTTIRVLNGILAASEGQVTVMGLDPIKNGSEVRHRTGVLTETHALDERLSGRENLEIFAELYDVDRRIASRRIDELIETFELSDRASDRVHTYSKGMKQRLSLARTIINEPEMLYLDEPTSALDPVAAHEVREMIRRWGDAPDRTVFLCTHNLMEAQSLCNRVGVLERGRLRLVGSPADLAASSQDGVQVDVLLDAGSIDLVRSRIEQKVQIAKAVHTDRLTVHLSRREDIPDLVNLLTTLDVPIYGVVPLERSLRDVYLSLYIEHEDGDDR